MTIGDRSRRRVPHRERRSRRSTRRLCRCRAAGPPHVHALAVAVADGELDLAPGADRAATRAGLLALPGIGPWTADYVAMRALADPDVLVSGDLGVRRAAAALGIPLTDGRPDWAPWRSYATHHLWTHAAPAMTTRPTTPPTRTEDTR